MPYIEGSASEQQMLFPDVLDDSVSVDSPVHFLDALDVAVLGFQHATQQAEMPYRLSPRGEARLHDAPPSAVDVETSG